MSRECPERVILYEEAKHEARDILLHHIKTCAICRAS
jgi:Pyruvate/2-oxoacid:ferredoxin oxidoreductase delta subunit